MSSWYDRTMVDRKYQVFISSTFNDLREQRNAIVEAVLEMGHIPVGMEMFSAGDESQWEVIARTIEQCDYYVVVLAHRYGSRIPSEGGISYTEKEYDFAVKQGLPVLGFVIDKTADWRSDLIDRGDDLARLDGFKQKVGTRINSYWATTEELKGRFAIAFGKAQNTRPRPGWVKADRMIDPRVVADLESVRVERDALKAELASVSILPPKDVHGLASLDSEIELDVVCTTELRYYTDSKTWAVRETVKVPLRLKVSMRDIFKRIGFACWSPVTTGVVQKVFSALLHERAKEKLEGKGKAEVAVTTWPTPECERLILHFLSVGLFKEEGRDGDPLWMLTPYGRSELSKLMVYSTAVKAADAGSPSSAE